MRSLHGALQTADRSGLLKGLVQAEVGLAQAQTARVRLELVEPQSAGVFRMSGEGAFAVQAEPRNRRHKRTHSVVGCRNREVFFGPWAC